MSYNAQDARIDEETRIFEAIATDDDITLFALADWHMGEGNEEYATWLLQQAKKARDNNWAYDEAVDNSLA